MGKHLKKCLYCNLLQLLRKKCVIKLQLLMTTLTITKRGSYILIFSHAHTDLIDYFPKMH